MEIYDDVGIKREHVSGRLTQKKVDDLIERTFPGYDNSSKRHFLQRWLKIKPSEWWTIQALYEAALMKGTTSISGPIRYEGQKRILREVKSLHELVMSELFAVQTAF